MRYIVTTITTEQRTVTVSAPDATAALEIAAEQEGDVEKTTLHTEVSPIAVRSMEGKDWSGIYGGEGT